MSAAITNPLHAHVVIVGANVVERVAGNGERLSIPALVWPMKRPRPGQWSPRAVDARHGWNCSAIT